MMSVPEKTPETFLLSGGKSIREDHYLQGLAHSYNFSKHPVFKDINEGKPIELRTQSKQNNITDNIDNALRKN